MAMPRLRKPSACCLGRAAHLGNHAVGKLHLVDQGSYFGDSHGDRTARHVSADADGWLLIHAQDLAGTRSLLRLCHLAQRDQLAGRREQA